MSQFRLPQRHGLQRLATPAVQGCDRGHSDCRPRRANIVVGIKEPVYCSQRKQYTNESDKNPSIRVADDCPAVGNHAGHGVRPSGCDNDSRGTRVLPPHGGAVWKFDDAGQSFLLQGSGTNEHCSSPGAGRRTVSSPHDCCDTCGRVIRRVAYGNSALPSFVSSCPTPQTVSRL
jgi:hypothetical protein